MRSRSTMSFTFAVALSAFLPSMLASQTPPTPRPARERAAAAAAPAEVSDSPSVQSTRGRLMRGIAGNGGRGSGHPAAAFLRARTQLELTDGQVERLNELAASSAFKSNRTDMMRAQADLLDATQGDGNYAGARAALDKLSRLRNDQMLARIKSHQDVRAVLTPVQKTKVDNMRQQMRNRLGASRQGGMRQGKMRQGGMRQRGIRQDGMRQGGMRQRGIRQGGRRQGGRGEQSFRGNAPVGRRMSPA